MEDTTGTSGRGSRGGQRQQEQRTQGQSQKKSLQRGQQSEGQQADLLSSVRPALNEFQSYIDGNPLRAAVIGAVAGGALMSIFATEKGRSMVRMAYNYANPMIAGYVKQYVSDAGGDLVDRTLAQH